jgi:hypothetical protein
MSWHTTAILIKSDFSGDFPGLLDKLGLHGAEPGGRVSFDEASSVSNDGVAAGTVDGWTALWGSVALFMVDDNELAKIAKKADVFHMILEGASGSAGFSWYSGGKLVRDWMRQEGKIINNQGTPLPGEKKAFANRDDEQAVLHLLMSLTGSLKRLDAIQYQMFEFSEGTLFGD